jgi:hypothetical protein
MKKLASLVAVALAATFFSAHSFAGNCTVTPSSNGTVPLEINGKRYAAQIIEVPGQSAVILGHKSYTAAITGAWGGHGNPTSLPLAPKRGGGGNKYTDTTFLGEKRKMVDTPVTGYVTIGSCRVPMGGKNKLRAYLMTSDERGDNRKRLPAWQQANKIDYEASAKNTTYVTANLLNNPTWVASNSHQIAGSSAKVANVPRRGGGSVSLTKTENDTRVAKGSQESQECDRSTWYGKLACDKVLQKGLEGAAGRAKSAFDGLLSGAGR